MGQPASGYKMVLERLDAELWETDDEGRPITFGKVAGVGVVGNEAGAHHLYAELFQALDEVGFTCRPRPRPLGRRGDAGGRLQGRLADPGEDREHHAYARAPRGPPGAAARARPPRGGVTGRAPASLRAERTRSSCSNRSRGPSYTHDAPAESSRSVPMPPLRRPMQGAPAASAESASHTASPTTMALPPPARATASSTRSGAGLLGTSSEPVTTAVR